MIDPTHHGPTHRRPRDDGTVDRDPAIDPAIELLAAAVRAAPPRCGDVRVVCVDGPAGSGKTTLADALARALAVGSPVHLDDLYCGWDQDLGQGLSGRVGAWLLDAWSSGLPGWHLAYDWAARRYASWVEVPVRPVIILEGCGAGAAGIRARASLLIWVEAPPQECLARGLARDGPQLQAQWRAWQAHERAHFAADGTREAAEVAVDGRTGAVVGWSPGTGPG
jgi:hypothetical protein